MAKAFSIHRDTGGLIIEGHETLEAGQSMASVVAQMADLAGGTRDLGNGYAWLSLRGLSFGGEPASLSLCFHEGMLEQVSWGVALPHAPMEEGWPTQQASESEVAFIRRVLERDMDIRVGPMPWGEVYSRFDPKSFMAVSGLRYHHR